MRRFEDKLEPLRALRDWRESAALRNVARLRRQLDALRCRAADAAQAAHAQSGMATAAWTSAPQPAAHRGALAWLARQEGERVRIDHAVTQAEAAVREALTAWEKSSAELDAVHAQAARNAAAHARDVQSQVQVQADAEWLARKFVP